MLRLRPLPLLLLVLLAGSGAARDEPARTDAVWLETTVLPGLPLRRHACESRGGDVSFNLTLRNPGSRAVHVDAVRFVYLAGDRTVRLDRAADFFPGDWVRRDARIDPGRRVDWPGICLEPLPESVTRVRMELDLASGLALRRRRATQSFELPVASDREPVSLRLPFEGYWRVTQGHGCRTNHRVGGLGGEYSWDFAAINRRGFLASEAYEITRRNQDTAAFGQPVRAPADGVVRRVVSDVPDNEGLREFPRRSLPDDLARPDWIFGNHVVLEIGEGAHVLLAHLQLGSVEVRPGQTVRAGEVLARCGNSGNTFSPHLHLQVMDRADPTDPAVRGVPGRFVDYVEFRSTGQGASRDVLKRHVDAGDPAEGSLLLAGAPDVPPPAPDGDRHQ